MKHVILNIADTGALESTAMMFQAIGWKVTRPNPELITQIRQAGCEGVHDVEGLVKHWGYAQPDVKDLATVQDILTCDLLVDVKAHVNYPRIVERWPNLKNKVLWCCLNGGDPLKRNDGLPWANPPCPILTNNQWYAQEKIETTTEENKVWKTFKPTPWSGKSYTCFPPYHRLDRRKRRWNGLVDEPVCLVHNVYGWGYGHLVEEVRSLGVKLYGGGGCPDGLIDHETARDKVDRAIAMVHLKVGDTVGYATYEALAVRCPLIVTQFYIDETRLGALLEPEVTCLTFDPNNTRESLGLALKRLEDIGFNCQIGEQGRNRLHELMWSTSRDADYFDKWIQRCYP